jgi:acyl carrier protein
VRRLIQTLDRGPAEQFSEAEMEEIWNNAFDRYFETSGLFGTPEMCLAMVSRLRAVGVDEVACLIDFGVDDDSVLESLEMLHEVKERSKTGQTPMNEQPSIADLIRKHGVTHLQCTPSLAKMLVMDPEARAALQSLRVLFLGGEALPGELLAQLGDVPSRTIHNMYGPTETTIWSTTARVDGLRDPVPIGRPLANTQVYILDRHLRPVPVGGPGELFIGGDGVAAGYFKRPELTHERFLPNPFSSIAGDRMYRTGDLVRYREDGAIEFLGRLDHQVKINGHRIELGEVEAALRRHPALQDAVVTAHPDGSVEKRLVAYIIPANGTAPTVDVLRRFLGERLPEYMFPAAFMTLDAFPLTPNGKIDRKSLPAPEYDRRGLGRRFVAPRTPLEAELVALWAQVLGIEKVGLEDNFFHLGGNSLSAVQVFFGVRQRFNVEMPLSTFVEAPTVAEFALRLEEKLQKQGDGAAPVDMLDGDEDLADANIYRLLQSSTNW